MHEIFEEEKLPLHQKFADWVFMVIPTQYSINIFSIILYIVSIQEMI